MVKVLVNAGVRNFPEDVAEVCAENVKAFLEGKTPPNLVPEQRS